MSLFGRGVRRLPAYPPFLAVSIWRTAFGGFPVHWRTDQLDCRWTSAASSANGSGQARYCRLSCIPHAPLERCVPARQRNCSGISLGRGEKRSGQQRLRQRQRDSSPEYRPPGLALAWRAYNHRSQFLAGQRVFRHARGNRPSPPPGNTDASADISKPRTAAQRHGASCRQCWAQPVESSAGSGGAL